MKVPILSRQVSFQVSRSNSQQQRWPQCENVPIASDAVAQHGVSIYERVSQSLGRSASIVVASLPLQADIMLYWSVFSSEEKQTWGTGRE